MATRLGKHKKGKVRMGVYVDPFRKAVAVLLADHLGVTLTDLVWQGIERLAIANGILGDDGKVTDDYEARLRVATEIVKQSEVNG